MKYIVLDLIEKVSYWAKIGHGELGYLVTVFREYDIPSLKEVLQTKKFLIYGYGGDSLRLRPHKEDMVGIGSIFDYEDDDDYQEFFISRQNLIDLLDQWIEISAAKPSKIFIINQKGKFYLTTKFPIQYSELHKVNSSYKLCRSNDNNVNLIGKLLEYVLKNKNFLKEYKLLPLNRKWKINELQIVGRANQFRIENTDFYCEIEREHFINLIEQWQKLVEQGPEKIYLILEDGDFRVTDVIPKSIQQK